ncbi:hypothetical protein Mal52_45640 [Symmachiella dynata]|uniref:Peptidase MA-like domain-containing protein n=1 Tax=Symmachiella dynata TaxID=2527995 RepID=A0A517ZUA4_9PLAN|nr:hypothetical protein [Symmachiella dynata]QDU46067.1 hypothetical protein Mal52_45640 [Symmachiella dynata]
MDALLIRLALAAAAITSIGAKYQSPNFTVTAPTEQMAQQVAQHAEHHRRELALAWLGHELPNWYSPCPVKVKVGQLGAGGYTSFSFDRGRSGDMEVFGWNMVVQGSLERVLDSVIPHEVSHTIFACHFRRPLPRWADEGAATLAEHESEKRRQLMTVKQILHTSQRIPLRTLLSMKEYPKDPQAVLSLYAQGYTLAELLVQTEGKACYLKFLAESEKLGWDRAIKKHYGYHSLESLEKRWENWIEEGCPRLDRQEAPLLAAGNSNNRNNENLVVRSQTPDEPEAEVQSGVAAQNGPQSRLVAPRPKVAARPRRTTQPTALAAAARQTRPSTNNNSRSGNEGWIAIRTSGRALPAMATSQTIAAANRREQSNARSRRRPNSNALDAPETSETPRSWPGSKTSKQQQISADRRTKKRSEFPNRTSRQ